MPFLSLLAPGLSIALLTLHFYRHGDQLLGLVSLSLLFLLFVRRPWAARLLQAGLVLAAGEWVRTASMLTRDRLAMGEPYHRLLAILGGVALLCLLSAFLLQRGRERAYFRLGEDCRR